METLIVTVSVNWGPVEITALESKDLFTSPEVAYRLSTTLWAVRRLWHDGQLKHIAIRHSWLVSPGAIQEFIRKKEVN